MDWQKTKFTLSQALACLCHRQSGLSSQRFSTQYQRMLKCFLSPVQK
ncbi:hypothetical protein LDG_7779 [Legionella drancourtii LLAP12]|uniref:Uncharacterized protein n=1 Tax=Legionella drancourtii LLAP12 TaxID=658187 RepID=G9ER68_9GAMM|nr:hypothetical protein LDG_7779 [Legionella drancourtii LLAP12]